MIETKVQLYARLHKLKAEITEWQDYWGCESVHDSHIQIGTNNAHDRQLGLEQARANRAENKLEAINACAEFEKELKDLHKAKGDMQWKRYLSALSAAIDSENGFTELHTAAPWSDKQRLFTFYRATATAGQRCAAMEAVLAEEASGPPSKKGKPVC